MKLLKTVNVARTAHDKTHVNRLVLPEAAVVSLRLEKGSTKSKSYLLHDATTPRPAPTDGVDTFKFAPGPQLDPNTWAVDPARTDRVVIKYDLYNPHLGIEEATLELFRRWDAKPCWTRKLEKAELADGENELEFTYTGSGGDEKKKEWDGSVDQSEFFPDGFVTTEHSPYKLRLTIKTTKARCQSPVAWTFFHVLVDKLELEYGDVETIDDNGDRAKERAPFATLKTDHPDPKVAGPLKIHLVSNIFKKGHSMFDDSLFTEYKTMWEHGPQIPLYAKIWTRDSADAPVLAPKALGKTRFLWDWESTAAATSNAFVDGKQNYKTDRTKPKGQNCHKDRGGKRDASDLVFPEYAGHDAAATLTVGSFPFEVKKCAERPWASLSRPWREGKLASKTGVMFRPARTAGDGWKVTVYAAHEVTDAKRTPRLAVDTDAPLSIDAKLKAVSGVFQVWRRANFVRHMVKKNITTAGMAGMQNFYKPAFLDLKNDTAGVEQYPSGEWNTAMQGVYNGWSDFQKYMLDPAVDQHASSTAGVVFRTRAQVKTYVMATFGMSGPDTDTWLSNNGMATDNDHALARQGDAIAAMVTLFDAKIKAADGVNLFHVAYSHNLIPQITGSFTDGLAHDFAAGSDRRCGFLWLAPTNVYPAVAVPELTPAHEFGHHFMLPHPRYSGENSGAKKMNDYKAHDRAVTNCVMSYNWTDTREFCGFCRLRLRGWSKDALNK
jgi:hypothetical protein